MFFLLVLLLTGADNLTIEVRVEPPYFEKLESITIIKEKAKFIKQKSIYNFMLGIAYFNEGKYLEANKSLQMVKSINFIDDYIKYYRAYSACKLLTKSKNLYNTVDELHSVISEGKGALPQKSLEAVRECEMKISKALIDENNYQESLKFLLLAKDRGYKNLETEFYIYEKYLLFNKDLALSFMKALSVQFGTSAETLFKNLDKSTYNRIVEDNLTVTSKYQIKKNNTTNSEEFIFLSLLDEAIKKDEVSTFKSKATDYLIKFPFGVNATDFYKKSNAYILSVLESKTKDLTYFKKLLEGYSSLELTNILLALWKKMDLKNSEKLIDICLDSKPNYDKILYLSASFYEDIGELEKAIKLYKKMVYGFGGSVYYHRALFKYAWLEMFNKKLEKSLELFDKYLLEGEDKEKWDITAALYYKAQIHKNLNQISFYQETLNELLLRYPYSFYSCISREELGLSLVDDLKNLKNGTKQKVQAISPYELFIFNRAITLIKVGLIEDAGKELLKIDLNNLAPKYKELAASIYRNTNTPQLAISISYNLLNSLKEYLSRTHAENHFPILYFDLIDYYSKLSGVEPYLILSIMKRESAFNKEAVSVAGAMGLLQMLPSLATSIDPKVNKNNLKNPDDNIKVAVIHLNELFKKYEGNLINTLAAYNAGDAALKRWQSWYGERLNSKEFIESISYAETRDYVKSVLAYYYMYNAIYNNKDLKFIDIINKQF